MPVILKWFYMVLLFHRWYIVLHLIGCGRSSMKILFVVVLSSYGNVIWCIVGLLVSRFALHFLSWVVVLKWWYLFICWYMVYSTRFTRYYIALYLHDWYMVYGYVLRLTDNFFLSYRGEPRRMYVRKKKTVNWKTTIHWCYFLLW